MQYIPIVLRSAIIITLSYGIVSGITSSENPDLVEQTIEAIRNCMARSPGPWPDEWRQEYIENIRKAILSHHNALQYNLKLEILCKGFESYWLSFKKTQDRSLFEVHRAQIRWYIEHLMSTKFPTDQERQKLRDQYKDLWDHAADSLLKQFPFLDPNAVQAAKAGHLSECYRKIKAPLMPVYLRPLSEEQVEQIKQRWDNMRYIRVDIWRRLGNNSKTPVENHDAPVSNVELDYELTEKSLSQLLGQVWMVASQRPDYYISALENHTEAVKRRLQSKRQARNNERRLEKGRSRQLLQIEHIGFLLSALLETPLHLDRSASLSTQEQIPSEQQDKSSKGGGAYEIENDSQKK